MCISCIFTYVDSVSLGDEYLKTKEGEEKEGKVHICCMKKKKKKMPPVVAELDVEEIRYHWLRTTLLYTILAAVYHK